MKDRVRWLLEFITIAGVLLAICYLPGRGYFLP